MSSWRNIQGHAVTFGPVPSRRLGQSLGINNIPPKICSYACVYCQLGRTLTMQTERTDFFDPERIFEEVRNRIEEVRGAGEAIDFLSFVPDGEPTLDLNLGREIELVRELGVKIAVMTNSSLIGAKTSATSWQVPTGSHLRWIRSARTCGGGSTAPMDSCICHRSSTVHVRFLKSSPAGW